MREGGMTMTQRYGKWH